MSDDTEKRVDESWKDRAEQEKQIGAAASASPQAGDALTTSQPQPGAPQGTESTEARFDLFLSGLAMEALIALGEMPHPTTKKQAVNLQQARYLIDLLGILEEKTTGNRTVDEDRLFTDTLYQLRMRYMKKSEKPA